MVAVFSCPNQPTGPASSLFSRPLHLLLYAITPACYILLIFLFHFNSLCSPAIPFNFIPLSFLLSLLHFLLYLHFLIDSLTFFHLFFFSFFLSFFLSLLFSTLLYSTLLYSTLLYSTLFYSTLIYSTLFLTPFLLHTFITDTKTIHDGRKETCSATTFSCIFLVAHLTIRILFF